jgi:hypothetical protein
MVYSNLNLGCEWYLCDLCIEGNLGFDQKDPARFSSLSDCVPATHLIIELELKVDY